MAMDVAVLFSIFAVITVLAGAVALIAAMTFMGVWAYMQERRR